MPINCKIKLQFVNLKYFYPVRIEKATFFSKNATFSFKTYCKIFIRWYNINMLQLYKKYSERGAFLNGYLAKAVAAAILLLLLLSEIFGIEQSPAPDPTFKIIAAAMPLWNI